MPDHDRDTLRQVAWSEVLPWLIIVRCFRLATSLRVLVLAAAGILLTLCGWAALGWLFLENPETTATEMPGWMCSGETCPWRAIDRAVPDAPSLGQAAEPPVPITTPGVALPAASPAGWQPSDPFLGSWVQLSRPLWEARGLSWSLEGLACVLLCGLWGVAVWGYFGGAITRVAAVYLASEERVGWAAALRHAGSKWLSYCAAPLLPLIGTLFVSLPVIVLGVLLREQYVGAWGAALLWPAALAAGLLATILVLGLVFGWPLMWATISSEGTDSFDALSRSYAYTFGRPLHYLFYAAVAAGLGYLGWVLVSNFAAGVVWATYWAASWGGGAANIELIRQGEFGGPGHLIAFWVGCVKLLAVGFRYGYFWVAATAIYLLLRHNVDATEMDEVFLDDDASETAYGLPPQRTDASGAPVIDDDVPEVTPDAEDPRPAETKPDASPAPPTASDEPGEPQSPADPPAPAKEEPPTAP